MTPAGEAGLGPGLRAADPAQRVGRSEPTTSPVRLGSRRYARRGERTCTGARAARPRARLLELAAQVFAEEGYGAVSVRDLPRRSYLTTGAIYAHFLNKAELLVEAIDARVAADVETSRDRTDITFREYLTDLNRRYPARRPPGPAARRGHGGSQ